MACHERVMSEAKNESSGPNGNRTRVTGLRTQRPRPLDDGANCYYFITQEVFFKLLIIRGNLIKIYNVFRQLSKGGDGRIFSRPRLGII